MLKVMRFFTVRNSGSLGRPVAAKKMIPKWYKESESEIDEQNGTKGAGLKKCVPFLDALVSGYFLVTPVDIFVSKKENGDLDIRWNSSGEFHDFIRERGQELGGKMPRPAGHHPNHLAFKGAWGFKTPRGWSVLVTQPLNRHDLPWTVTSGIMDADKYSTGGNIPFFMREDFVGMVPAGTPFAQLIPVKRASWKSIDEDKGISYLEDLQGGTVRSPGKSYKKLFWVRKDYS